MKITKKEKKTENCMTENGYCKEENSNSCCIHKDEEKKLIFLRKIKVADSIYMTECDVLFCPFCGFSYQPERLSEKTR